jgi:adenylosuccinate synthase
VAYRLKGQLIDELPVDADLLAAAEPVYEELPGWAAAAGVQSVASLAELPANAQSYVARISELSGLSFSLVSVGPGREETIVTKDLFPTSGRV